MIEDKNGSLDLAEAQELLIDRLLELAFFYLLLGVAAGMGQTLLPCGGVVGERDMSAIVAAPAFPLVLGDVDGDAVEVGGKEGLATKVGEGSVEAKKDLLGKVVEVFPAACQAQEGSEDHGLMVADHLLEGEIVVQGGLDHRVRLKFQSRE